MLKFERNINFERLDKTLRRQPTEDVPLIELGIHPFIKENILGRKIMSVQDDIEFMRGMGYDFIKVQPTIKFELNSIAAETQPGDHQYKNEPDRAWAPEQKGVVTSWEELEKYNWPKPEDIDYSRFEEARKEVPDDMGVIGQYGDIFTVAWELMGFETFAMATYEQPDLVEELFNRVGSLILGMFDTMADMDWVKVLWFSDDIAFSSGTLIHPDTLRAYFFPMVEHIGDLAKIRDIPFIYHTDGVLWDVMDDIINAGAKALHPIEPKSMDIFDVHSRIADKVCICGGIDLDLLARGTTEEVKALTEKHLDQLTKNGYYCAGSSNSITEYVNIDNYKTMNQTVLNFRK